MAASRVFATAELFEKIMEHLDYKDLFVLQRISTTSRDFIADSPTLQRKMHLLTSTKANDGVNPLQNFATYLQSRHYRELPPLQYLGLAKDISIAGRYRSGALKYASPATLSFIMSVQLNKKWRQVRSRGPLFRGSRAESSWSRMLLARRKVEFYIKIKVFVFDGQNSVGRGSYAEVLKFNGSQYPTLGDLVVSAEGIESRTKEEHYDRLCEGPQTDGLGFARLGKESIEWDTDLERRRQMEQEGSACIEELPRFAVSVIEWSYTD